MTRPYWSRPAISTTDKNTVLESTSRRCSNQAHPALSWVTSDRGKYDERNLVRSPERRVYCLGKGEEGGRCDVTVAPQTNYCVLRLPSNKVKPRRTLVLLLEFDVSLISVLLDSLDDCHHWCRHGLVRVHWYSSPTLTLRHRDCGSPHILPQESLLWS